MQDVYGIELSEFEKSAITEYHRYGQFLREMTCQLNYSKSAMIYVIQKWKMRGGCRNMPVVGDLPSWAIETKRSIWRNSEEMDPTYGRLYARSFNRHQCVILTNTIRKTAHLLGFYGYSAAHKPLTTTSNRSICLRWFKHVESVQHRCGSEKGFSGVMNKVHSLPFEW